MRAFVLRLINLVKRSQAPLDDLDELLAERRRLEAIAQWRQTEMMETVFRLGYWTGRCGVSPRAAWETSMIKRIQDRRRKELAKPIGGLDP